MFKRIAEMFKINRKLPNGESASTKIGIDMECSASSTDLRIFFKAFDIARKTPRPKVR